MKAHMINLCRGAFYLTLALICCQLSISTGIAGESGQSSDTIKAGAGQSNARPIADKWAVLIGIDRFKDTRIPSLDYASKDAIDFGKFLVEKGHFAKDHVLVLTNENATRDKIRDAIGGTWLPSRAAKDDLVLIFASTHGSPKELDVGGENFLVAHDSDSRNLYVTGIRFSDLAPEVKERTGCDRVVLLLDACNSGAANVGGKGLIRTSNFDISSLAGEGQIVISSSAANQRSFESKRCTNGVFTRHLISALQKQGQNTTITEAFNYLKEQVENEVRFDRQLTQTPVMRSKWSGGELILVAVPTKPRQIEPIAAETTDAEAQAEDAYRRADQLFNEGKYSQSVELAMKAANAGHPGGQYLCGVFCNRGIGQAQDARAAAQWWQKSADQDFAAAQCWMGNLYRLGKGVPKNPVKAVEFYRKAADQGNAYGQYLLAMMYEQGTGVPLNRAEAYQWYQKAALQGEASAQSRVKYLRSQVDALNLEAKPVLPVIPNLAGDWLASYGAHYQIWQNGREYGWKFPHEEGRGVIADDGKTARCRWWGKNNGTDTATLEYDSSGMVVRIVGSNGVTLTRQ